MFILGIESSCDETAVSLIERGDIDRVIWEKVKSQIDIHSKFGGVVPEIASRSHLEAIEELTDIVLTGRVKSINDIDLIAVTSGPGLIGSLLTGLSFAKGLSYRYKIPLVGVNHVLAHSESPFITHPDAIQYPVISLVASGGHTSLIYFRSKFDFNLVASTRDDAAGEVMDKAAKYLGLGYPGGPVLDTMYEKGDPKRYKFTVPKMSDGSDDLSFSGYKTALIRYVKSGNVKNNNQKTNDLVSSFLYSIVSYLMLKLEKFASTLEVRSITVAGGVSRNSLLREMVKSYSERSGIPAFVPGNIYCTDNATMIAWLGYENYKAFPEKNYFDSHIDAYSRNRF